MDLAEIYKKGKKGCERYFLVVECTPTAEVPLPPPKAPWDYWPNENILAHACHVLQFLELGGTSIYRGYCQSNGDITIYAHPKTIYHRTNKQKLTRVA